MKQTCVFQMSCCGKTNFTDWFSIDWDGKGVSTSVPASCCKDEDNCIHTEISPDMPDDADIYIEVSFPLCGNIPLSVSLLGRYLPTCKVSRYCLLSLHYITHIYAVFCHSVCLSN